MEPSELGEPRKDETGEMDREGWDSVSFWGTQCLFFNQFLVHLVGLLQMSIRTDICEFGRKTRGGAGSQFPPFALILHDASEGLLLFPDLGWGEPPCPASFLFSRALHTSLMSALVFFA